MALSPPLFGLTFSRFSIFAAAPQRASHTPPSPIKKTPTVANVAIRRFTTVPPPLRNGSPGCFRRGAGAARITPGHPR